MVMVEPTDVALSTAWPRGNQRAQQAGAGVFHQIEHGLEARLAAVVRVRDIAGAVAGAEVGQAPQLVRMLGRAQGAGGALVGGVHHQHPIEIVKVLPRQFAGALTAQVIAAPQRVLLRPLVRRRADVPAVRAGRIDVDAIGEAGVLHPLLEHAYRGQVSWDDPPHTGG